VCGRLGACPRTQQLGGAIENLEPARAPLQPRPHPSPLSHLSLFSFLLSSSLLSLSLSHSAYRAARLAPAPRRAAPTRPRAAVAPRAKDLDTVLADFAAEFEQYPQDRKVATAGWAAAGLGAVVLGEKIMHTVVFDVLLGFPIQLLGLLVLPGLVVKALDGKDLVEEGGAYVSSLAKRLPGLDK